MFTRISACFFSPRRIGVLISPFLASLRSCLFVTYMVVVDFDDSRPLVCHWRELEANIFVQISISWILVRVGAGIEEQMSQNLCKNLYSCKKFSSRGRSFSKWNCVGSLSLVERCVTTPITAHPGLQIEVAERQHRSWGLYARSSSLPTCTTYSLPQGTNHEPLQT